MSDYKEYKWEPMSLENPFLCRQGEKICNLDNYIKNLKEYGYSYTDEQLKEARKEFNKNCMIEV